jgi:hypothetical protein
MVQAGESWCRQESHGAGRRVREVGRRVREVGRRVMMAGELGS